MIDLTILLFVLMYINNNILIVVGFKHFYIFRKELIMSKFCPILSYRSDLSIMPCDQSCALYDKEFNCCSFLSQANVQKDLVRSQLCMIDRIEDVEESNYAIANSILTFKDSFDYVFKDMEEHIEQVLNDTISSTNINNKEESKNS